MFYASVLRDILYDKLQKGEHIKVIIFRFKILFFSKFYFLFFCKNSVHSQGSFQKRIKEKDLDELYVLM